MLNRSALEIATRVTLVVPSGPTAAIVSCVVYSYDSDGRKIPERPTRKSIPSRGETARPAPSLFWYAAPMPIPTKPNMDRLNGKWKLGSAMADHSVAEPSLPGFRVGRAEIPQVLEVINKNPADARREVARPNIRRKRKACRATE